MATRFLYSILIMCILAFVQCSSPEHQIIVASDGSGNFKSIQDAINATEPGELTSVIYIKAGTYNEKLVVPKGKNNIHFLGEGIGKTVITYDDYAGKGDITTGTSYTMKVRGNDIKLEKLTIENREGMRGQAVALFMQGDHCLITNCHIKGNQDALYASGDLYRQYFRDCKIEGTTDFIFGSATALFERCEIHCKKHSFITAASTPENVNFGYVFKDCRITAAPGITKVYLGRPWRDYAKVVFMNCHLGIHIRPEGWHNWDKPEREKTAFYAEYQNYGPGADVQNRVEWSHQLSNKEAASYNVEKILNFSNWKHK
ncbi:MAG: pectinesterase family protein [Prolixibacteraceae bacterium]|jgi:pectinesterase|nr:pectinesterase family protein [Prolixibacteraceae bacterium]